MQSQRKQGEMDRKVYDDLLRERDILSKVLDMVPFEAVPLTIIYRIWEKLKVPLKNYSIWWRSETSLFRPNSWR